MYVYIDIYLGTIYIYSKSKRQTVCAPNCPNCYQSVNGFVVTHALGHIMYGYTLLLPMN